MSVRFGHTIPILRIFDVAKAREFYVDYLGCNVDYEERSAPEMPAYIQVSRSGFTLHLSEHYSDGSPGTHLRVEVEGLAHLRDELAGKAYQHIKPNIVAASQYERVLAVIDPFANRLLFFERSKG